jgi:hypothetical protein
MFTKNAPAREYKGSWVFGATNSSSYGASAVNQGASADSVVEVTYGNVYNHSYPDGDPRNHGFKVTYTTHTTNLGVSSYSVDFESPWWSGNLASGASFLAAATVDIDIVNCLHNCGCNAWALSFDSLTIKYGGSTIHTIGAQSQSGTNYDPRNDRTRIQASAGPYLTITFGKPNCQSYAVRNDYTYSVSGTTTIAGFWQWKESGGSFTSDTIVYDTLPTLPNLGCIGCATSLVSPTGTTSSTLADSASYSYSVSVNDLSDYSCWCEPAHTLVSTYHLWQTIFGVNSQLGQGAYFVPNVSPIRAHDYRVQETCTLDSGGPYTYDSGWVSVTDSVGTSIYTSQTESGTYTTWCNERFGRTFPCAVPPNSGTVCDVDPIPSDVFCHMVGSLDMRWPTKPPCVSTSKCGPWIIEDDTVPTGRLHQADFVSGNVRYRRAAFPMPYGGWDVDKTITSVGTVDCVRFDIDNRYGLIELYYHTTGGDIYAMHSTDDGATWTTPVYLMSAAGPFFTASTKPPQKERFRCWFDYNSGSSGPGKAYGQYRHEGDTTWSSTFTFKDLTGTPLAIADGGMSNVSQSVSNQGEWAFAPLIDGDTDVSDWRSDDFGRTWKKI